MVNEEKVRLMTKLAIYEDGEGKRNLPLASYYRSDYISAQMIKSFIWGTIAFCGAMGIWFIYEMEVLMNQVMAMDMKEFAFSLFIKYLIFLAVYLVITYVVSSLRYTASRKSLKKYAILLKKVSTMQQREEALRPSAEWNSME